MIQHKTAGACFAVCFVVCSCDPPFPLFWGIPHPGLTPPPPYHPNFFLLFWGALERP